MGSLVRWLRDAGRDVVRSGPFVEPHVLAALLHFACGVLVLALLPVSPDRRNGVGVALVAVAAVAGAGVIARLPWHRWRPTASLWLVPESLLLVAVFNVCSGDPHLFSLFYVVTWAWVGLTQRPGVAVQLAPLLAVGYVAPALVSEDLAVALASGLYVVPICVVVGETVARVADRLRRSEDALAGSEARLASLVRNASDFVAVLDAEYRFTYTSAAFERVLGWDPDALLGQSSVELVHGDDHATVSAWFEHAMVTRAERTPLEYRALHSDGTWRWVECHVTNLLDDPAIRGIVVNGRDISERRAARAALEQMAFTDPLTGLANRAALRDHLGSALSTPATHIALLFVDLDGFKVINDSLGHPVGDEVLRGVTARLVEAVAAPALYRIGGDEFVVVVEGGRDDADAIVTCADAVLQAVALPFELADRHIAVSASIGIATSTAGVSPDELLRRADLAMYRAKRNGRNRWALYDEELARNARRRLDTEAELRDALDRGELFVEFQPEIDLETSRIVAAEALVRWRHPERGRLGPEAFIDIAEATGLIIPLGEQVLREAVIAARSWAQAGFPLTVSVNVSSHQLRAPKFVEMVNATLAETRLPAPYLRLELTESALLDDDVVSEVLPALRSLGVQVAIDDFGTGYSSLAYLQQLTVDALKIDKSFLEATIDGRSGSLIAAVVAMAHNLDLRVVAEGLETPAQLAMLRSLGCDRAQGFLLARPISSDDLLKLLRRPPVHLRTDAGQTASASASGVTSTPLASHTEMSGVTEA